MGHEITFGQWLKQRRQCLGLTQAELARRAGYAQVTLRKVEADGLRPSDMMTQRLAVELDVPPTEREAFLRFARRKPGDEWGLPNMDALARLWSGASIPPSSRLPLPPTAMIGRADEVAAIQQYLLHGGTRLVTLTGPGGVGKTTLALEAVAALFSADHASDVERVFRDGVCFVPLASVNDPGLILDTIAHTLRLQETGGRLPLDMLRENLRERGLLLVLDNFEHLIAAAPLLATLLQDCPGLKALVTSRETLHLRGEKEWVVEPLAVPLGTPPPSLDELLGYAGVRLFVARAQDARHSFALTHENAAAVAEICRRLDGLPLALELAASRIKMLSPQEILTRLSDRLAFLTQGARDLPDRHQALRATIDWSYNLLDEPERTLFRRLSVFAGGWTLDAFEAVCNADSALDGRAFEHLTSLVDKSLVRQSYGGDDQPRFSLLETIREYAAERLTASGEADMLRDQWARHFAGFAESAAPRLSGPAQLEWLDRVEEELENLRAVLSWTLVDDAESRRLLGLRVAAALWRFWSTRSLAGEGPRWFAAALNAVSPSADAALYAHALLGASTVAMRHDNHTIAIECARLAIDLCNELNDERGQAMGLAYLGCAMPYDGVGNENAVQAIDASIDILWRVGERWGLARALNLLGLRKAELGRMAEAQALFRESAALFALEGDDIERAQPVAHLGGMALLREDYDEAEGWLNEALSISMSVGHTVHIATAHKNLGCLAYGRRDNATALEHWTEALPLYREAGNNFRMAIILRYIGLIAWEAGNMDEAVGLFMDSLAVLRTTARRVDTRLCLVGLAGVCVAGGDARRAARLLGYAQARGIDHAPFLGKTADMLAYRRVMAAVGERLDAEAFAALRAEGGGMTESEAIALALEPHGLKDVPPLTPCSRMEG